MMMKSVAAVLIASAVAAPCAAEDLAAFLAAATAAARPQSVVRADGELVTTSPDGSARDRIAILRRRNGDLYIELHDARLRALLLADGSAFVVPKAGAARTPFALDAALDASELTREDLQPFAAARFGSPTIVDRNPSEVTISLTPQPSQYTLQVITFDSAKHVPVKVMAYKDTLSNLLRMRRERGLVEVGGTWLPAEISVENFPLRTTTTLALQWKAVEHQPALFDPAALDTPSALTWP